MTNDPQSLTCQQIVELITDYLEGHLAPEDQTRFEHHLSGCTGCRRYVEQMRQTIRLVGKVNSETLAPVAKQELLTLFRAWKTSPK